MKETKMIKREDLIERAVVIYHDDCMDGLASAWLMNEFCIKYQIDNILIPMQYGDNLEEIIKKNEINQKDTIYFVDFSLKREQMKKLLNDVHYIVVLDHHETAKKELNGLENQFDNIEIYFDMKQSGAMLTYNYTNERGLDVDSLLFEYVQDRDLWNWELLYSREVSEYLKANVKSNCIESFNLAKQEFYASSDISNTKVVKEGSIITSVIDGQVESKLKKAKPLVINGVEFMAVNTTENISELGNAICLKYKKPACIFFYVGFNKVVLCFRGTDEIGFSLGSFASLIKYNFQNGKGGGGHALAAGATITRHQFNKLIDDSNIKMNAQG